MTTTRADIVSLNLVVGEELLPGALPKGYERAGLRLFESESVSRDSALDLMFGTWDDADLIPDTVEAELAQVAAAHPHHRYAGIPN